MSDLISRQALQEWIKDKTFGDIVVASEHNFDCLPSVTPQPEKRTEERTETHACDCISRQAAIQAVTHFDDTLKRLYELPSVEPERNPGKWEYVQYDGNPKIGNWHCSECRLIVNFGFDGTPYYHYCPGCGAKMEVDE